MRARASGVGSGSSPPPRPRCCRGAHDRLPSSCTWCRCSCLLAAPLTKPLRVPVLLWYTHWHAGRSLRLAVPLVDVVLSVGGGSFPLATPKLHATGHAIDVTRFTPSDEPPAEGPLRLVALGRTARWKGYDTMLTALELATKRGLDAELELRGPQLTEDEKAHRRELETVVAGSEVLRHRVRIEPPLARDEIPALLRGCDALLSATQPRTSETLDKVVYEAAACGVPVIASNTALDEFLAGLSVELRFRARDAESLAQTLLDFSAAGPAARRASRRRASPPRRRRALRRSVGGYCRGDRYRPDSRVTSSPWRPSPRTRFSPRGTATSARRGHMSSCGPRCARSCDGCSESRRLSCSTPPDSRLASTSRSSCGASRTETRSCGACSGERRPKSGCRSSSRSPCSSSGRRGCMPRASVAPAWGGSRRRSCWSRRSCSPSGTAPAMTSTPRG